MSTHEEHLRFSSLRHGPKVLQAIQDRISEEHDNIPVSQKVQDVLAKNRYLLSKRQIETFFSVVEQLEQDLQAVDFAKAAYEENPMEFSSKIAEGLGYELDDIHTIESHDVSISIGLSKEAFSDAYRSFKQQRQEAVHKIPAGFTHASLRLQIGNQHVPYSLYDAQINSNGYEKTIPPHEDQHHQYAYMHPTWLVHNPEFSRETYRSDIQNEARKAAKTHNTKRFEGLLKAMTRMQLYWYLNERTAYTVTEAYGTVPVSVYDKFFGKRENSYNIRGDFTEDLKALRAVIPDEWESLINHEVALTAHKALYIETGYERLKGLGKTPAELIAILQFLTPERAYIIKAYAHNGPLTLSFMKDLRREYETLPKPSINSEEDPREHGKIVIYSARIKDREVATQ